MKTLQELYSEILKSEELKKALAEAVKNNTAGGFLKAHGCAAGGSAALSRAFGGSGTNCKLI